jgi:uncharacterized protein (UPF0548 family)
VFSLKRPTQEEILRFLANAEASQLTYSPVGLSRQSPPGYNVDEFRLHIGSGAGSFERAAARLESWDAFRLGWTTFHPSTERTDLGANVAIVVRHLGFWSLNGCRVTETFDDASRRGFAYGTLEQHAESGEESFAIEREGGDVWLNIRAVSRPRAALAKVGYPISRRLQKRFREDVGNALKSDASHRTG